MDNFGVSAERINYLCDQYGSKALEILALTKEDPELANPISPELPDIKAQIVYAVRHEFAHNFIDIACRRTMIAIGTTNKILIAAHSSNDTRRNCFLTIVEMDKTKHSAPIVHFCTFILKQPP